MGQRERVPTPPASGSDLPPLHQGLQCPVDERLRDRTPTEFVDPRPQLLHGKGDPRTGRLKGPEDPRSGVVAHSLGDLGRFGHGAGNGRRGVKGFDDHRGTGPKTVVSHRGRLGTGMPQPRPDCLTGPPPPAPARYRWGKRGDPPLLWDCGRDRGRACRRVRSITGPPAGGVSLPSRARVASEPSSWLLGERFRENWCCEPGDSIRPDLPLPAELVVRCSLPEIVCDELTGQVQGVLASRTAATPSPPQRTASSRPGSPPGPSPVSFPVSSTGCAEVPAG